MRTPKRCVIWVRPHEVVTAPYAMGGRGHRGARDKWPAEGGK